MIEYTPQLLSLEALTEKAKSLPATPGVYLFFGRKGEILYVGKSKALQHRVLSYFQNLGKHGPKTEKLVRSIADFQTIVTATEAEALILENEKIKLHRPKFNIRLKDDKDYPYIRLTVGEEYPRLEFARRKEKKQDRSRYFGPYSSGGAVRTILDTANKLFCLPTCKRKFPQEIGKGRPCLFYHLGKCIGVCMGGITPQEYQRLVEDVILFLKHDHKKIIAGFRREMEEASEAMNFERAAVLRDRIRALEGLSLRKQVVRDLHFSGDVFGLFQDEMGACINLLAVREGSVADSTLYHFGAEEILTAETFATVLIDLYRGKDLPRAVYLPELLRGEDLEAVSEVLSRGASSALTFQFPERGDGRKLLEMAQENARAAALHRRALYARDEEILVKLSTLLGLEIVPQRIESIDISNSGTSVVSAGIITLLDGRFRKRDYKSFLLQREHPDDPDCMYEAVSRRIQRYRDGDEKFSPLPDLILADGAQSQVEAVKRALREKGVEIPVFGMVKDSFHKTRCLTDGEHEISIAHDPALFQWIYGIQEEVHRYGFSRMDARRRKSVKTSVLTGIPGIGEKKASALLKHFGSLKKIKSAGPEELCSVRGISRRDAEAILAYYETKNHTEKESKL